MNEARELLKIARELLSVQIVIDFDYVKKLKRMMASDIRALERAVSSPEDAEKISRLSRKVGDKYEKVFYNAILKWHMTALSRGKKPEETKYSARELQGSAWDFVMSFSDINHHLASWPEPWSKYYSDFEKEKKYVFNRIKRKAKKAIDDAVTYVAFMEDDDKVIEMGEKITVGRYVLMPMEGVGEKPMKRAVELTKEAQRLVSKAGFGKLLSRMIVEVRARSEGMKGGHYAYQSDYIAIFPLGMSVETYIHELGHRKWYGFMSPAQRNHWKMAFEGDLTEVTSEEVEQIIADAKRSYEKEEKENREISQIRSAVTLTPHIRSALKLYSQRSSNDPVAAYKVDFFSGHVHSHSDIEFWSKTWRKDLVGQRVMKNHVTDYGNTNEKEAYAEVFRNYVMGKRIPPEVMMWFRKVSGV